MKVLLSPAKSINENPEVNGLSNSEPVFKEETERLAGKLAKLSARQIKKLMKVNDDIANLNYERYQDWGNPDRFKPAGYLFAGSVFQALNYSELSEKEKLVGQDKIRILSGLYGVLKPLDLIQPYRLEMGTSFKVTPKVTNLYKFWGDKIRLSLESELANDNNPLLVNVASTEYFKAAQLDKMNAQVITTVFKDKAKDGQYKVNMTYAKLARGWMSRYIIQNNIDSAEGLKGFDLKGYTFSPAESSESEFIYSRDKVEL